MSFASWLKNPFPAVTEFVEKSPTLSKIFGYTPESPLEFAAAGLGVAMTATMGLVGGVKAIGTAIIKAVPKIAKVIIPKTIKGKIIATTAAVLGVGILKESPLAREKVVEVARDIQEKPFVVFELGEKLGKAIEGKEEPPSLKEALITGGIVGGLGALVVGGIVVAPKIIEKIKEAKKAEVPEIAPGVFEATPEQVEQLQKEKPLGVEEAPLLPETVKVTPTKKPYKRRRAIKRPSVKQSVRINIINKPVGLKITNKRYLNELIYSR